MSTVDLDAIRELAARYADATWDEEDGLARDLADEMPALVAEVEQLRRAVMDEMAERDAALVEVERLRQLYADHRAVIEAQAAEVERLRALLGDILSRFTEYGSIGDIRNVVRVGWTNVSTVDVWRSSAVPTGDGTGDTDG